MGKASTAERARNIALEVASYRLDYEEQYDQIAQSLDFCSKGLSGGKVERRRVIANLGFDALRQSHTVIQQAERALLPRGEVAEVTRRTLAMTALAGTSTRPELNVLDNCCFGAELKFVHGLDFHRSDKKPSANHDAALILHDIEEKPFAYQKAVGHPYAYVWRDSTVLTRAGPRSLLAGSIVRPMYDRDSRGQPPPHEEFAGAGLVGVTGCVADEVEFMRFTLEVFPCKIRKAGLMDASSPGAYSGYNCHVDEAMTMNGEVFAGWVAPLIKSLQYYI